MDKHQALAIYEMAEGRYEYNMGVLAMMGKSELAVAHRDACAAAGIAAQDYYALLPQSADDLSSMLGDGSPEQAAAAAKMDDANRRRAECWAPIQALIDEAADVAEPILSEFRP